MAKESGFQVNLGYASEPASPNYSTLAEATVIRGQAAAKQLTFLGEQVNAAMIGYTEAQQDRAIEETVRKTYNPETQYIGGEIKKNIDIAQAPELARRKAIVDLELSAGPPTPEVAAELQSSNNTLRRIKDAELAKAISPEQARTEIAAHVRKSIAAYPGLADKFREQAQKLTTGVSQFETEQLLKMHTGKTAAERQAEQENKYVVDMVNSIQTEGLGRQFGVNDLRDIDREIRNRTTLGSQMIAAQQAMTYAKKSYETSKAVIDNDKLSSGERIDRFMQATMGNVEGQAAANRQISAARLATRGIDVASLQPIDLENPSIVNALLKEELTIRAESRKMLEGQLAALNAEVAKNPTKLRWEDVKRATDDINARIKAVDELATASVEEVLSSFKKYTVQAGQTLDTNLKTYQAEEAMLRIGFGQKFLEDVKTPGAMASLREQYQGNKSVQAFIDTIEARQNGMAVSQKKIQQWQHVQRVSDGMFNPDAPPSSKAVASEATAEEKSDATQIVKEEGKSVLKNGGSGNKATNAAVGFAASFSLSEIDEIKRSLISDDYKNKLKTPEAQDRFVKATGIRIERWLSPQDKASVPQQLAHANLPENLRVYAEAGQLMLRTVNGERPYGQGAMHTVASADKLIEQANKMLDMYAHLGGDRNARAAQLVKDIAASKEYGRPTAVVSGAVGFPRMDMTPERQALATELKQQEAGNNLQGRIADLEIALKQAKNTTVKQILQRELRDLRGS